MRILFVLSPQCLILISFACGFATHRHKRFTKGDICHETHKTLEFVTMCPDTEQFKLKQSQKKQCDSFPACNGELLVYHCVRYRERLAEVCAPRRVITGKCCALYDDGLGRVVADYSRPCSECSFKYQSDDALNYTKCLKTSSNHTNVDENTRTKCDKQLGRRKRDADCSGDKENDSDTIEGSGSPKYTNFVAPIVASVVFLIVMIGVGAYLIQKCRNRRITTRQVNEQEIVENEFFESQYAYPFEADKLLTSGENKL